MRELLAHYRLHVGEVQSRFESASRPTNDGGVQLLRFRGTPLRRVDTVATLGLSRHLLTQPSGRPIRQEFVGCARSGKAQALAGVLGTIADSVVASHRAILRGQVFRSPNPLFGSSGMTCLVCLEPWYWPAGFERVEGASPTTMVGWLVPITECEARLVEEAGVDKFESMLTDFPVDLVDFGRTSVA